VPVDSVIKPVHIAALCFVGGVIAVAVMILATSATGDATSGNRNALLVTATFVRDQLYDEVDAETATPVPEVVEAEPQSTQLLAPPPPPAAEIEAAPVEQAPEIRSCAAIRDTETYLNDAERDYFLSECADEDDSGPPARPGGPSATATPRPSAATLEVERAYRVKAESIANSYLTLLRGYSAAQLRESESAATDYGARAGGWANQLENFAPVPQRFRAAHQRLQTALWELAAHTRLLSNGQASLADEGYRSQLERLIDASNAAIDSYFVTLGLSQPGI
jgi:hypothetical protein